MQRPPPPPTPPGERGGRPGTGGFALPPLPAPSPAPLPRMPLSSSSSRARPPAAALPLLTSVPQLLVPIDGQNHQQVAQDVHHDGEDEDGGQGGGHPGGPVQGERVLRPGAVQLAPIAAHAAGPTHWAAIPGPSWAAGERGGRAGEQRACRRRRVAGGVPLMLPQPVRVGKRVGARGTRAPPGPPRAPRRCARASPPPPPFFPSAHQLLPCPLCSDGEVSLKCACAVDSYFYSIPPSPSSSLALLADRPPRRYSCCSCRRRNPPPTPLPKQQQPPPPAATAASR